MKNEQIIESIQAGTGNQKELFTMLWENMRGLTAIIARKFSSNENFDDNMQQGFIGLYEAARHYDSSVGVPFSNYARLWIRQSITRYLNENGAACRFPSHIAELKNRYKRCISVYQMKHGSSPDDEYICSFLEVSAEKLSLIRAALQIEMVYSTESPVSGTDDVIIADIIPDPVDNIAAAEDRIQNEQLSKILWPLVDNLEPEQSEVIRGRFREGLTRQQVDNKNGWRAGRSADLEYRALCNLRRGRARRALLPFIPERIAADSMRGNGVNRFNRTWTSSTERAALKLLEG